jgi:glycosyltransferase involved in cell wall biosynthesis
MKTKITAIIPTFNEEIHIEEAIQSVSFADEIIIIDSFSTDATVKLAERHDVKVLQRVFDDFSSQKNFAISKASNEWIFILDSDERIEQSLKEEIVETLKKTTNFVAFSIKRNFYFLGKRIKYSGWQRDSVVRLFSKSYCKYNGDLVHELIETKGKIGFLRNKINHYSYRDFEHYVAKLNRNSWLKAKKLHQDKKNVNPYNLLVKPPVRFLTHYVVRLGFLDGFEGFILASIQSYGVFMRYIKLWLINNKKK